MTATIIEFPVDRCHEVPSTSEQTAFLMAANHSICREKFDAVTSNFAFGSHKDQSIAAMNSLAFEGCCPGS